MIDDDRPPPRPSRRAVLHAAAWSVPVVALAAAAPLAAASATTFSLAWTGATTSLVALPLLDGGGVLTSQNVVTVPTRFTIVNGPSPITAAPATITIGIGRPTDLTLSLGRARGIGVWSVDGVRTTAGERTAVYETAPIVGQSGFPATTWTGTRTVTVAPDGAVDLSVVVGLAGASTGVTVSALATFPVTLTVTIGGTTATATTTIPVPVGAGIL